MFDKEFHLNNINRIIREKVGDVYFPILNIKEDKEFIIVENAAIPTLLSDAYLLDNTHDIIYKFVAKEEGAERYLKHLAGLV